MILRKPYGFLIKHFRMIHLILFFLFAYVTSRANNVLLFFKDFIKSNNNMEVISENYFNISIVIFMLVIIALLVVIYYLMRYKKKPRMLYIVSIIIVILSFIMFVFLHGNIKELEISSAAMSGREIRLLRDISRFNFWGLFIICIPMLVRGLGFDIKKFNFTKDLKELNLTKEDSEEVEVSVDISKNAIQRLGNKSKRELKYYYLENKFFINIILGVIIFILLIVGANKISSNRVLKEGSKISTEYFNMIIEDSYISEKKKNISEEYNYLIVKVRVKGKVDKYSLNLDHFVLRGSKNDYIPTVKYYNYFSDIGPGYLKDTYLNTKEYEKYILIYNIKDEDKESSLIIEYLGNNKKVKLSPERID